MSEKEQLQQNNDEQLRKYRELAKLLREWRAEPDNCDWSVIEAEINNAGMNCYEPELAR